jgi:D-alanine transaminase
MIAYFNGSFVQEEDIAISPHDRGFLFGDGAYEVVTAYGGKLFRADEHLERLRNSLESLQISMPDPEGLKEVFNRLIRDNRMTDGMSKIYLQVTRGAALRQHAFPDINTRTTIFANISRFLRPENAQETGIAAILVPDIRWSRCDIKSISLVTNVLASQAAKEQGAKEAVFYRDGFVTEGAHTNFFAVFKNRVYTYPESNYILSGVTRNVVIELCNKLDIETVFFPILVSDLNKADEMFVTGTTTEVMPVVRMDKETVGDGKPGPITKRIREAYLELTR